MAGKMVNVNREVQDTFYRYKMPMVVCKVEGRGNGIKTAIPNMVDIARALERPPSYPTKYLGVELGAQTQMYPDEERYIINGAFEADRFQEVLDGFIKKFVLCFNCSNPETTLKVTKKKEIQSSCRACGHTCNLPLTHKLTTFIINNPPEGSDTGGKKGRSKDERRAAKIAKGKGSNGVVESESNTNGDGGDHDDNEDGPTTPPSAGGMGSSQPIVDEEEDEDDMEWSVDTSEEAARLRAAELGTGVTGLTATNDLEKPIEERLEIFEKYVLARMGEDKFPAKEVVAEADRLDCKDKGVMVLVGTLFKEGGIFDLLAKYHGLLQRFTLDNPKAEKNCLVAFEKLIEMRPELLPVTAKLFKDIYDRDIIDEERFVAWADKASKKNVSSKELAKQIQAKAKPFIEWLREAEEEESEDDDTVAFEAAPGGVVKAVAVADEDDDDDEDADSDDADKPKQAAAAAAPPPAEEEEDDLDIDDI